MRLSLMVLLLCVGFPAYGQWSPYEDYGQTLSDAAAVVSNLTSGLAKSVDSGQPIISVFAARSLSEISDINYGKAAKLGHQQYLVQVLKEYAQKPSPEAWGDIARRLAVMKDLISRIMHRVHAAGPELVRIAGPQYVANLETVGIARGATIDALLSMSAPTTPEEIAALTKNVERYETLLDLFGRLAEALHGYLARYDRQ